MFGHYDGRITTVDGDSVNVRKLVGWAGDHIAKW
ncbi:MAG: DUF2804 family protein [Chloroflexota bacterium]|nr:MAG: DUF2804 family protein [Chloroflexota bacterium]